MYTANLGHLLDLFEKDLPTWKTSSTLQNAIGYTKQNEDSYELAFDVVGHPKENISIDVEGNKVAIKAESLYSEGSIQNNLVSTLNHSIRISNEYDLTQISAEVENGILFITIPKKKEAKEKKISVKIK